MANAELAEFLDGRGAEGAVTPRPALGLDGGFAAPEGAIEQDLAALWQAALNVDRVGVDDDFFALGGDSLAGARLFAAIECAYGRRLPLSALVEGPTIRHLAALLTDARPTSAEEVLVPLRAGGSRAPLFCIHDLSGNVVVYRRLAARLGDDQPVYGLQYPGQHLAEPPRLALGELAARLCEAIRAIQPAGPYFLAGYSLGGAVAYEIALRQRAAGEAVGLLALLDSAAPGTDPTGPARVLRHIGEFAHRAPWTWPAYVTRRWRNRRRRQRNDRTLYRSTTADGLGARLERLATEVLPQAWRDYAPGPYDGQVVLFRCAEDIALWRHAPDRGWNALIAGGVEAHDIPATHQDLMHEPAVAVLAERLADCLRTAQEAAASR